MFRHRRTVLVAVFLLVSVVTPVVAQSADSDPRIADLTYTGDGSVDAAGGELVLWRSGSHAFTATVAVDDRFDGEACLVAANGTATGTTIACQPTSIPGNATANRTVAVDRWPKNVTGPSEVTLELRTNGSTVATSDGFALTLLRKGGDLDDDGLTNEREFAAGTDVRTADTDGDGLEDGPEVNTYETSPTTADSDGDGLSDRAETRTHRTDPMAADTDGDGLPDAREAELGTNPNEADSDGDGLDDAVEVNTYETNATRADTDGDGLDDGTELEQYESNPTTADTDDDGLGDALEVNTYGTGPNTVDSDGDGLADGAEVNDHGTDPTAADTDGDGLTDGQEVNTYGTSPTTKDSDDDGLADGAEVNRYGTDPTAADTDGDGRNDRAEVTPRPWDRLPTTAIAVGALATVMTIVGGVLYRSDRGLPIDGSWFRSSSEGRSTTDTQAVRREEGDGTNDHVPPEFLSNEERIQRLLEDNGGRMRQAAIVERTGWSKSKVSRVLSSMADSDAVVKVDVGKGNVITLPDRVPPGAESPFDE